MYEVFKNLNYEGVKIRRPFYSFNVSIFFTDLVSTASLFRVTGRTFVYIESIDFCTDLPEDIYKSLLTGGNAPHINFLSEDQKDLFNFKPIKLINYGEMKTNFGFMVNNKLNQDLLIQYVPNWIVSPQSIAYGATHVTANISINYAITTENEFIEKVIRGQRIVNQESKGGAYEC